MSKQNQKSVTHQIEELIKLGNAAGLYDAVDLIRTKFEVPFICNCMECYATKLKYEGRKGTE